MLIFQGISPSKAPRADRAVTIGNFDGVHLGHQSLIRKTVELAQSTHLRATVVTFEPHPKAYFRPQEAPGKIQGLRGKAAALAQMGVDELRVLKFRQSLAAMPAEQFMRQVLHESLNAKAIVIGDDFRFGAKRQGDLAMLKQAQSQFGWQVFGVHEVLVGGERASSSSLRKALVIGDLEKVRTVIGRPYTLHGHVIHGKRIGRDIGFPTLNIPVHDRLIGSGVFVASVEGLADAPIAAVASLGRRPTVESQGRLLLEVHLFDWQGDAYGKLVCVTLHEKIRDEIRYDNLNDMTRQIDIDASTARQYFSHHAN